jgi:cytoskeletal protein CcmA (bactofilin family)
MKKDATKHGGAMVVVLTVIITLSGVMISMVAMSSQRAFTAQRLSHKIRAVALAEAGVNQAYTVLVTNFSARTNPASFPPITYGGGTYDCTVTPVGTKVATISCDADWGIASAEVMIDIRNYGDGGAGSQTWDEDAFNYAMLSGGNFDFGGCGTVAGTNGQVKLHANGTININGSAGTDIDIESSVEIDIGNNKTIEGDVTAPVLDYNPAKVTITGEANAVSVDLVDIPNIDLTPYYNWAMDNSEVYTPGPATNYVISANTYISGGILWVEGDIQLSGNPVTINGAIFATGNIYVSGQVNINKDVTGFAMASRDGSIQSSSSGTLKGLVYAKTGDYIQTANGALEGQLIVGGNIRKGGNSDMVMYERIVPTPPGGGKWGDSADLVGVSAWQK